MKLTKRQLRRLIEMSMIKTPPVDPSIDDMIDAGDRETADFLQTSVTDDEDAYSYKRYSYEYPFMQNPGFLNFLEDKMKYYISMMKEDVVWAIENTESFKEFVDGYLDPDEFKNTVREKFGKDAYPRDPSKYAAAIEHTFGTKRIDKTGHLNDDIKKIYVKVIRPIWKDWREYFNLPV